MGTTITRETMGVEEMLCGMETTVFRLGGDECKLLREQVGESEQSLTCHIGDS